MRLRTWLVAALGLGSPVVLMAVSMLVAVQLPLPEPWTEAPLARAAS